MTTIRASFDGTAFVPKVPVDLPLGDYDLEVEKPAATSHEDSDFKPAAGLVEMLSKYPPNPDWPQDMSEQIDHYLYGTPKR
jgi:hypothetical protein